MKKHNTRQNELLKKYYDLNSEQKIINISLHYDRASDILDTSIGNPLHPQFKDEVLQKINSTILNTKQGYKLAINFEINDYENYTPKNIIESFNDTLELKQYASRKKRQVKELISSILILIGTLLLLLMAIVKQKNIIVDETNNEIVCEIIDIIAWVFIWEAATMLFLEHSEQTIFALQIRKRVTSISFYKKGEIIPLEKEPSPQIFCKWDNEAKINRIGKYFTLISSVSFIFFAFYSIYLVHQNIKNNQIPNNLIIITLLFIFSFLIPLLAGAGGIAMYLDKTEKIRNFVGIYTIFMTILIIIGIISSIIRNNSHSIFSSVSSLIIHIFYILGFLIEKYDK